MKIWAKIRALFNFRGELAEVEVSSAEIRRDKVFLHPLDDENHTICVNATNVDILINPECELTEDDVLIIENERSVNENEPPSNGELAIANTYQKPNETPGTENGQLSPSPADREPIATPIECPKQRHTGRTAHENYYRGPQMKVVSFRLYPEEYDMLMTNIQTHGYRKTEYLLACIAAAKKNSMEATYKQYFAAHQERRKAEREAARKARSEQHI